LLLRYFKLSGIEKAAGILIASTFTILSSSESKIANVTSFGAARTDSNHVETLTIQEFDDGGSWSRKRALSRPAAGRIFVSVEEYGGPDSFDRIHSACKSCRPRKSTPFPEHRQKYQ
jgi:hypothetical protein